MLFLKLAVLTAAVGFFTTAVLVVIFEAQRVWRLSHAMQPDTWPAPRPLLWRKAARLVVLGCLVMLPGLCLVIIPSGIARTGIGQRSVSDEVHKGAMPSGRTFRVTGEDVRELPAVVLSAERQ